MASSELAKRLPPFGIRDLNGPRSHPGIIHISVPQYDSTIRSQPDAVLTYLDDDDGETITVGSGFELEQRLDEPVMTHGKFAKKAQVSSRRNSTDDNLIHLFDIRHTSGSLAVWRDHEAYSSKSIKQEESASMTPEEESDLNLESSTESEPQESAGHPVPELKHVNSVVSPCEQDLVANTAKIISHSEEDTGFKKHAPVQGDLLQDLDEVLKAACLGLESHVAGLGSFLDTTANALRLAAEKTREADTTPVEGFLDAMKNILSEVGGFGLDLLREFDSEAPALTHNLTSSTREDQNTVCNRLSQIEPVKMSPESCRSPNKQVSFVDLREGSKQQIADKTSKQALEARWQDVEATVRAMKEGGARQDLIRRRKSVSDKQIAETSRARASFTQHRNYPNRPGPVTMLVGDRDRSISTSRSILDLETSDPDFSMRYPPLMSLRRAKTVSDLKEGQPPTSTRQSTMTTRSALARYPSIDQLEVQGRPGANQDQNSSALPQSHQYHRQMQIRRDTAREVSNSALSGTSRSPGGFSPSQSLTTESLEHETSQVYCSPAVQDESDLEERKPGFKDATETTSLAKGDLDSSILKPLPGSWPEPKPDEVISSAPTANESSGAFFNRMTAAHTEGLGPRPFSPALSCRISSPPTDPFFPNNNLRRAQTVTASNPAARLNRPFDPLTPVPRSLFGCSTGNRALDSTPHPPQPVPIPQRSQSQYHPRSHPLHIDPPQSHAPRLTLWTNFPKPEFRATEPTHFPPSQPQPATTYPRPHGRPAPPHARPHAHPIPPFDAATYEANRFPRPMRSEPNFIYPTPTPARQGRAGYSPPPMSMTKVDECVKQLRQMGYGASDPIEAARLDVYAGAAAGDVMEAVDMIEEDREAAEAMNMGTVRVL